MGSAGQPRRSRVKPVLLVLLLAAVLVLVGGYFVDSRIKGAVDGAIGSVRNLIETTTHPPGQAFDGKIETFWLADPGGGTPAQRVPLTETVDLIRVLVHSGAGAGPEFTAYGRPRTIEFQFPSVDSIEIELEDDPAAQEFELDVPAVGEYVFRIIDFYEADDPDQHLVALRDVILTFSIP